MIRKHTCIYTLYVYIHDMNLHIQICATPGWQRSNGQHQRHHVDCAASGQIIGHRTLYVKAFGRHQLFHLHRFT